MPMRRRGDLARRHPDRRIALPARRHVPFEVLVERALEDLPNAFRRLLEDVAIVIEDVPTEDQSRLGGADDDGWLYGLYEGVSAVEWGADLVPFPNKITLFRLPLEEDFPDPDDLAGEVRRTVLHELAHHAGISDERLHELRYD
ncbi:MAG TPA: metallopeptidase family protein [Candidatus Limnocylindrales bacterium]|nr:metallopeptidase family protein [Candidatus Limnocylindrales bacterium]